MSAVLAALIIGFGLGASVAAQLGPLSLLVIRSTLRNGIMVGLALGAGIAVIDTAYAAAGAAGVLEVEPLRLAAGIAGAAVLALLAGVGLGSLSWMSLLTGGVSVVSRLVGDRLLKIVDALAGIGLIGFGGVLAVRTLKDG